MAGVLNEIHHISACALITPVNQKSSSLSGNCLLIPKNSLSSLKETSLVPARLSCPSSDSFLVGDGHFMRPQISQVSKQIGWCYIIQKVMVLLFKLHFTDLVILILFQVTNEICIQNSVSDHVVYNKLLLLPYIGPGGVQCIHLITVKYKATK